MLVCTLLTMPLVAQDMGIFNTLASELVDDDADYLAIVLQEIAERFALQEFADSIAISSYGMRRVPQTLHPHNDETIQACCRVRESRVKVEAE